MRPRLPLCLLPVLGALSFFATTGSASGVTLGNDYSNAGNYAPFNINDNALWETVTGNRPTGLRNDGSITSDITIEFNVTEKDISYHPVGGVDYADYGANARAIFIQATQDKGNPTVTGTASSFKVIGGKTLTFASTYTGTTAKYEGTGYTQGGYAPDTTPMYWTYVVNMSITGDPKYSSGNVAVKLDGKYDKLVIGSTLYEDDLAWTANAKGLSLSDHVYGTLLGYANGNVNNPMSLFNQDILYANTKPGNEYLNTSTVNVSLTDSNSKFDISQGIVVYSDVNGSFTVGGSVTTTGNGYLVLHNAKSVKIGAVNATEGYFYVEEGVDQATIGDIVLTLPSSGGQITDYSTASRGGIYSKQASVNSLKVLNGSTFEFAGAALAGAGGTTLDSTYTVGTTTVSGYANRTGATADKVSTLTLGNGDAGTSLTFTGKVNVNNYGVLIIKDNANITFNDTVTIGANSTLALGNANLSGNKINLEDGSRLEISCNGDNTLTDVFNQVNFASNADSFEIGFYGVVEGNVVNAAGQIIATYGPSGVTIVGGETYPAGSYVILSNDGYAVMDKNNRLIENIAVANVTLESSNKLTYNGNFSTISSTARTDLTNSIINSGSASVDLEFSGIISGSGQIGINLLNGFTTATLSGANTFLKGVKVLCGQLEITNETYDAQTSTITSSSLGAGNTGKLSMVDGTGLIIANDFDYNGNTTGDRYIHKDISLSKSTVVNNNLATTLTYDGDDGAIILAGTISGSTNALIKNGSGEVRFSGDMTGLSGAVLVEAGTVGLDNLQQINKNIVFQLGDRSTNDTVTLDFGANESSNIFNNTIYVAANNADFNMSDWAAQNTDVILKGSLQGVSNATSNFIGSADTEGDSLTFAGGISNYKGILNVTDFSSVIFLDSQVSGPTAINLNGADLVLNTSSGKTIGFKSQINGAGQLVKTGEGSIVLESDLSTSFTEGTDIEQGTLQIINSGKICSGNLVLGQNGTIDVANTNQEVNQLTGSGSITSAYKGSLSVTEGSGNGDAFAGNINGNANLIIDLNDQDAGNNTFKWITSDYVTPSKSFTGNIVLADNTSEDETTILELASNANFGSKSNLFMGSNTELVISDKVSSSTENKVTVGSLNSVVTGDSAPTIVLNSATSGIVIGNNTSDSIFTGVIESAPYQGGYLEITDGAAVTKTGTSTLTFEGGVKDAEGNYIAADAKEYFYNGNTYIEDGTLVLRNVVLGSPDTASQLIIGSASASDKNNTPTLTIDLSDYDCTINQVIQLNDNGSLVVEGGGHTLNANALNLTAGSTLNMSASLTQNEDGQLEVVNTNINVSGTINAANGSKLKLDLAAGNWAYGTNGAAQGTTMTLLTGEYDSTMPTLDSTYLFLTLTATEVDNNDQGNDTYSVTVTRKTDSDGNLVTFSSILNGTGKATAGLSSVASSLDKIDANNRDGVVQTGSFSDRVVNALYVMSDTAAYVKALESLTGTTNYVLPTAQMSELRLHTENIRNRASDLGYVQKRQTFDGESNHIWAQGIGRHTTVDGTNNAYGFKNKTWGGTVGYDVNAAANINWGLAFTYADSDISIDNGDSATSKAYYVDFFTQYQQDKWNLTSVATLGMTDADITRYVKVGSVSTTTNGSTNGMALNFLNEISYTIDIDDTWIIQPLGSVTLGYYSMDSYTESGAGDLSLNVESVDQFIARLGMGVRAKANFEADEYNQRGFFEARATITQDLTEVSPSVTQRIGSGSSYDVQGTDISKTAFQISVGVSVPLDLDVSFFANANTEFRSSETSLGGNIGLRWTF